MRGTHQGASIEGSDKVEYCSVPKSGVPRDALGIQAISTLYECGKQVLRTPQRRKVSSKIGDNFSVEERGKECYAELKISCRVSTLSRLGRGVRCGMGLYDMAMCRCVHLLSFDHVEAESAIFSSWNVGQDKVCQHFVCEEKIRNCLKISAKYFVNSDFLCIFARFLCALCPRVRERSRG